jgi:hypothetical protein
MAQNSIARGGLDKRKACVFLILVAVGILCLGVLAYILFYAEPHANSPIKNGSGSIVLWTERPGHRSPALGAAVRS